MLREEGNDISVAHYDLRFLKPLDEGLLHEIGRSFKRIVTIEDAAKQGGMGHTVTCWMNTHGYNPQIRNMGIPDAFVEHGSVGELRKIVGLDLESIKQNIIA